MKIPRYTAGLLTGVAICLLATIFCYNYLYFPCPSSSHQSATTPFYVTEDHPHFFEYQLLNSVEYWDRLSSNAEKEAKILLEQKGLNTDITVHCDGSAQGYTVYYSLSGHTSLRALFSVADLENVIVDLIDSNYRNHLYKITNSLQ